MDDKEHTDCLCGLKKYHALTKKALESLKRVTEKWSEKYSNCMKNWKQNRDAISPIFKFSADV